MFIFSKNNFFKAIITTILFFNGSQILSTKVTFFTTEKDINKINKLIANGDQESLIDAMTLSIIHFHRNGIKKIIKAGFDVNAIDALGNSPLIYAALCGREQVIDQLLKAGVDVNKANETGLTPLMCAVIYGQTLAVTQLLKAKSNVNAKTNNGTTALMFAAVKHNRDSALFESSWLFSSTINIFDSAFHTTAAQYGKIVRQLIDSGANLDTVNTSGWTALMLASRHNHYGIMGQLLEAGAINQQTNYKYVMRNALEASAVGAAGATAYYFLYNLFFNNQ